MSGIGRVSLRRSLGTSCPVIVLTLAILVGACVRQETETRPKSLRPSPSLGSSATTPPATSKHPILKDATARLAAVGDFGTGDVNEATVAEGIRRWVESRDADALVTTGDNVYPEGDQTSFRAAWTDPYGWVQESDLDVIASLGNHDIEEDGGAGVMQLLHMPGPWYRTSVGDADLFVLDANRPSDPEQVRWLEGSLESSNAKWKIVVFHQPAFSCAYHDGTPEVVEQWVPLFEQGGVDLVLNGHDHNYQRFEPFHGVTYVVTGGGGAPFYELDACPEGTPSRVAEDDDQHHFLTIEASPTTMHVTAVTPTGSVIDDFTLDSSAP